MKRTIGIVIVLALLLGSCSFFGMLFNPIVGTWQTTILGVDVSTTFKSDATFTDTNSLGVVGVTQSGTWESDSASSTLTKTWADESTDSFSYSFNSDKSVLTLTSGIIAFEYNRQ